MGGVLFAKLFSTEKKTVKMELRDSVAGRQKAGGRNRLKVLLKHFPFMFLKIF